MDLRIKELLREQGLRMSDLADRIGTDPSNLKKSLANNPKLSTLQDVAKALNVKIHELFTPNLPSRPNGVAVIGGRSFALVEMPCIVQIPLYSNYSALRKDIEGFIRRSVSNEKTNAFGAIVDGYEFISLVYDQGEKKFILTLYYEDMQTQTFFFDLMEFAEWKEGDDKAPVWNLDDLCDQIISDVENVVPFEFNELTTPADREIEKEDKE